MSDLDRYLSDEIVEKAAVAIQLVVSVQNEIHLTYMPEYADLLPEHKQQRQHEARRALEAVLPDIVQQAKAEALRDAADRLDLTGLQRNSEMSRWEYDTTTGFFEELVTEWLTAQSRADRIEHDAHCPHPKCPGGGLCCCLPEQGGQP